LGARRELCLALGYALTEPLAHLFDIHRDPGSRVLLGGDVAAQRLKVLDLEQNFQFLV
jgi:hypothetical protein